MGQGRSFWLAPISDQPQRGLTDADGIFEFVERNDERLTRFFPTTRGQNLSRELSRQFVANQLKRFHERRSFAYTLREQDDPSVRGLVYLKELNWNEAEGELAYCIDACLEGTGVMTEVVKRFSQFALSRLDLKRLLIISHQTNIGSIRVAEKAGFHWDQTLESSFTPPGGGSLSIWSCMFG